MRWPLALNPPYLFSVVLGLFFVCFVSLLGCVSSFVFAFGFLEGFKGQVRLPEGPPHLAINPP